VSRNKQTRASVNIEEAPTEESVTNKIPLDDLIPVMSLIDYPLNLLNQNNNGRAKYRFDKFGQTKQILYQDMLVILENYMHFLESGVFTILDKRVINRHGLQEITRKILTREQIDKIITGSSDAIALYKSCGSEQQKLIIGMLTRKLTHEESSVDMNLVDAISRLSKVNILKNAEDARFALDRKKEEQDERERVV